ncbi:MAG: Multi antimicrobial extrusion protein (Na(+)/drug antiporter), MATE family of MDR efflux pumps [uncultured Campylobacterales bacterium]|uniref:Multidrug-efflux transporter n=1 Tax=uncultured Campylobacterales bacterium TaxID=352960 RepID=A0A6S6T0G7_9BACT|nr:MAG: Multi antimicrobial extrusion protein (Na(+)/drug antiporter), MATE family of MDR efflux pumps [uncultured Campylobacterales bacterium]
MNKDLTTKEIPSLIRQIAIPTSTGMFFNTMYNVVDTFYAGLISTQAIAALSLSFTIYFLIMGLGYGFSSAVTALMGNAFGEEDKSKASAYGYKALVFIPVIGMILSVVGYFVAPWLFVLFGASDEYLDMSVTYVNIIFIGSVFFMLNYSLNAILVSIGDTKTYRNTLIAGFFLNLILNYLFIYGFWIVSALGVAGIAMATVLIQVITMTYMIYKVTKTGIIDFTKVKEFLPNIAIYKEFLVQGIPSCFNMFIMGIGSLIFIYFVSVYDVAAVAGYGIGFRVEQLMLLPALGISISVLTLVSNNYGAKKYDRVKQIVSVSLKYGFIVSVVGLVVLTTLGKFIISLFDSNEQVVNYGFEYVFVEVWVFYAYFILFVCVSVLQGIKKPKMIFYIALYRQIIALVVLGYIVVKYLELDFVYLCIANAVIVFSASIFAYFYTVKLLKEKLEEA